MPAFPIAIIGMACRLPGAADLDAFWRLLRDGVDAVGDVPSDRWDQQAYFSADPDAPGKLKSPAGGFIADIDKFDAEFFGISPREARKMDPQQRLLLEVTWEALENAGLAPSRLAGSRTGVYVGVSSSDYASLQQPFGEAVDAYCMTGGALSIAANRLSYVFDLRGPSLSIDTACSSALVALHQACAALRRGEIPLALAGGVNALLTPYNSVGFSKAHMLSPNGQCRAFDAEGDGYVRAEGCGMVVLKPLAAALADGDDVVAVIHGTGVNSDGRTKGISLPNPDAQERLLRDVYAEFGVDPSAVAYVEAHGTGTPVGDPAECAALGRVIGAGRAPDAPCLIGSVKTNIGHLESGSGIAGLIKTALALKHREIPASLHFKTPNPNIPFDDLHLKVVTQTTPLPPEGPLLAGVNSFGFGGTNAHAILGEGAPTRASSQAASISTAPLLISARSRESLAELAARYAALLRADNAPTLGALAHAVAARREVLPHRLAIVADDSNAAAKTLEAFAADPSAPVDGSASGEALATTRVAFVFSGNGSQWRGMGRSLLGQAPAFAAAVAEVDAALRPLVGWSVRDVLMSDEAATGYDKTEYAQPALFAVQVGIVRWLAAQGIAPDAVAGHSVGEVAAAYVSGALSLPLACRVIAERSRAQSATAGQGRMAAVGLSRLDAETAIAEFGDKLTLAAINGPHSVTLAGDGAALENLGAALKAKGVFFRALDINYAFHSASMDPIRAGLTGALAGLAGKDGDIPFVSTVEGRAVGGASLSAEYWWRNVREPVNFAGAIGALLADGVTLFVEIGPRPVLENYLREIFKSGDRRALSVSTLRPDRPELPELRLAQARLAVAGKTADPKRAFTGEFPAIALPGMAWRKRRHWFLDGKDLFVPAPTGKREHPLLGRRLPTPRPQWTNQLDTASLAHLKDHVVGGQVLFPAAGYFEMALAALAKSDGAETIEIDGLDIRRPLPLGPQMRPLVASALADMDGSFAVTCAESEEALSAAQPIMVCRVGVVQGGVAGGSVDLDALRARLGESIGAEDHYRQCRALGLDYGPAYQGVAEVRKGENEALGRIVAPASIVHDLAAYRWHPAMLDACLQVVVGILGEGAADGAMVLPTGASRARFALRAPGALWCHAKVTRVARRDIFADLALLDDSGARIGWIENLRLRRVEARGASRADFYHWERILLSLGEATPNAAPVAARAAPGGDEDDGAFARRLDALVLAYARRALAELGGGEPIAPLGLAARGVTGEGARRLTKTLEDLQSHGLAAREGARWRLGSADGGDADAQCRAMLADFPGRWALLDAIARRGAALAQEWRGGEVASSARLNAETDEGLRRTRANAQDFILRQCLAAEAPMRVLELGDGAPDLLGDLAVSHPHEAEWLFLDGATATAEGALSVLRLGDVPEMQALAGAVGLVVVDGARRDVADTLALAKRLLSSGGCLVVLSAPDRMASDFLGATPGGAWREALTKAGFALAAGGEGPMLVATAPLSAPTAQSSEKRAFAALTDAKDSPAAALIARLKDAGHDVSVAESGYAVGASVYLYLRTGPGAPDAAAPGFDLVALAHALDAAKPGQPATVIVVTRGALEPFAGRGPSAMGALWGVARTIANERGHLSFRMIDTDDLASEALLAELTSEAGDEDQIVLRAGKRFALRLRRDLPLAPVARETPYRLIRDASEGLAFEAIAEPVPAPGEVLVRVKAAALNFRDVLQRLDVLPDEAFEAGFAGATLGMEMAGEVLAVGAGVGAFKPGDAVFGFAKAAMASHVVAPAGALFPKPKAWSFAAAASLPVVALTVAYSLGTLARLEKGETILIHGAAGGVGLAAIQFAQSVGATIFATAGNEERRDFVRRLGVEHVFDSRSLAFADEIRAATGGRGVDVVLNSLSGEALVKSVSVLAPYGRFVELGKRDFYANSKLGLQPFRNNLQFHGVDVDQLLRDRPDIALKRLAPMLAQDGTFRPLPHTVFPATQAHEAFRRLQQSKQIGKVVLAFDGPCPPGAKSAQRPGFAASPDATYVVTGGRRGFGLASAQWLAAKGARHLALIGRHSGDAAAAAAIARVAADGVDVREFSADVADEAALGAVLATIKATMPPLGGIVHAAAIFDDCALANLTPERFAAVMAPKILGARNLDELTRDLALDFFVLYSSATTLMGNPGQANYVAANAAMESLAAERRSRGAPALAIAWGAIGEVGHVAQDDKLAKSLTDKIGLALLPPRRAFAMLEEALASPAAMVGVAALDWRRLAMLRTVARSPAFAALRAAAGQDDSAADEDVAAFAKRLATLPPDEALELVTRRIADHVAKVTQADGALDPEKPIVEFGLDSLMAVELQMGLEKQFAVSLPMLDMHSLTIGGLARKLQDALGARGEEAATLPAPPTPERSSEGAISDLLAAEIDRVKAKRETAASQ